MSEKKVDWQLPIQTRDGRKARYLGTLDGCSTYPVVVAVRANKEYEHLTNYTHDGYCHHPDLKSCHDIINTPAPIEVEIGEAFINVYQRDGVVWIGLDGSQPFVSSERAIRGRGTNSAYLGPARLPTKLTIEQ